MKKLLISALTIAILAFGWSAVSVVPVNAYSPPSYVVYHGYKYYLSDHYYQQYCIYETFNYHHYIYCQHHSSGSSGGGSSY